MSSRTSDRFMGLPDDIRKGSYLHGLMVEAHPPRASSTIEDALPSVALRLPPASPTAAHCTNDECPDYVKIGQRRYIGELLPGCRAQCRKCGGWVQR